MNQLEQQAAQKEDEINTAAEDLKRSEERSAEQYEDMKVRIQYIYEMAISLYGTCLFMCPPSQNF